MGRLYIYLHAWLIFMVNKQLNIAYMDGMGFKKSSVSESPHFVTKKTNHTNSKQKSWGTLLHIHL